MYYILYVTNVIAFLLMLWMCAEIIKQRTSKAQLAFIVFDLCCIFFVIGLHLELIHSETVGAALNGLVVQYFGQCGFLMALLWFAQEFINLKVPRFVYLVQGIINTFTMVGVLTAEYHTLFYSSMTVERDGLYNRIDCAGSILWFVHYIHFFTVFIVIIVSGVIRYKKSDRIQKKRIMYISVGLSSLLLELILKMMEVFGSYNPVGFALVVTMYCIMIALVKYGYFASLDAAMDNALNHGEEGLLIIDIEGNVVFMNQKIKKLLPQLKVGDRLMDQKEIMETLRKEDRIFRLGEDSWELRMEDIIENEQKSGSMVYLINLTEHTKYLEEVRSANEAKTKFLMQISHELRTPLNVIVGMNEMIIENSEKDTVIEYADMIKETSQTMLSLVEEVIQLSRIEQEKISLEEKDFPFKAFLGRLDSVYSNVAENRKLTFKIKWDGMSISEHTDKNLYGDKTKLWQILSNLLNNAFKYTERGEILFEILSDVVMQINGEKKNCIRYVVTDSGLGIPEKEQQLIFDSFTRGAQANRFDHDGLGLGLFIVKKYTEAMGGKLVLFSRPEEGSSFSVFIPETTAELEKMQEQHMKSSIKSSEESISNPSLEAATKEKSILIVDDYPQNIRAIKHFLKDMKLNLDTADSGLIAVTLCDHNHYDLLIIDYMMPSMDGIETLKKIRESETGKNRFSPAIMLTANAVEGVRERSISSGYEDYLLKPILPEKLRKKISNYLMEAHGEQQMQALERYGIHVGQGIAYADNDLEFYKVLLKNFSEGYAQKQDRLSVLYQNLQHGTDDWNLFTSEVHSLKGETHSFGADHLGNLFAELEQISKEQNFIRLSEKFERTMKEYEEFVKVIEL